MARAAPVGRPLCWSTIGGLGIVLGAAGGVVWTILFPSPVTLAAMAVGFVACGRRLPDLWAVLRTASAANVATAIERARRATATPALGH